VATRSSQPHSFGTDLALYVGGAILFSFPLLMTMEMWWLGFYMDRLRLALFLAVAVGTVVMLSHLEGEPESSLLDVLGGMAACAVGFAMAALLLLTLGIIEWGMSTDEVVGKIVLHAIPASIGAILARRILEIEHTPDEEKRRQGFGITLFLMAVGSIFLAFQLAPTEEMVLIAHKMSGWHAVGLMLLSLVAMSGIILVGERNGSSGGASGS
jgi:putative integral membrane protein (TIGR02587 family)